MENFDNINDELKEIAPNLSKLSKDEVFETPVNYFNDLQAEVLAKVNQEISNKQEDTKTVSLIDHVWNGLALLFQPKVGISLAGFGLLFFAAYQVLTISTGDNNDNNMLAEVSSDQIEAYIYANIDEFEDELFEELDLSETETELLFDLESEDLEEYIDEHIDEFEDLEDIL